MNKAVYYYHEFFGNADTTPLISLWERSWRYWGWEPNILTAEWAIRHPKHDKLVAVVEKWPTGATVTFNVAACRRYCAMAAIGGGLQSDADIMNYGFTPEMAMKYSMDEQQTEIPAKLILFDALAAGPAFGTAQAFEDVIDYFLTLDQPGKYPTQCCEMTVMRDYPAKRYTLAPEVIADLPWQTSPMVHYGNGRWNMAHPGVLRSKGIPLVRPLRLAE